MNTLFILNDPPYGTERSYNGLRLAGAVAKREGESVRVFLMGDAAACAKKGQSVPNGYYNLNRMLQALTLQKAEIGVCGSCMDARGIAVEELVDGAKRSTLEELATWTIAASKVIVF
ncbi:MAG: DsrE/DsrF/TusD sulfur relay family protein [Gemmatimonadaceae bacterium]